MARRLMWLGRGSKGERGRKTWAGRGQVIQGPVRPGDVGVSS